MATTETLTHVKCPGEFVIAWEIYIPEWSADAAPAKQPSELPAACETITSVCKLYPEQCTAWEVSKM